MRGDLITKKLPKYKRDAMERIARLCFEELNPLYNNRFSYADFESATYRFQVSWLIISVGGIQIKVKLYGDFPRVVKAAEDQPLISYNVAKKIIKKLQELEKQKYFLNSSDTILITDFNLTRKYLRLAGRLGTRVQYKGE